MPQRIACLAKGRVAAKDRNQGANGASKETFVLLRVKQNACVRVCVCACQSLSTKGKKRVRCSGLRFLLKPWGRKLVFDAAANERHN